MVKWGERGKSCYGFPSLFLSIFRLVFFHSLRDGRKALHLSCCSSSSSRLFWTPTESGCLPRAALPARRRNWVTEMVGSASRDEQKTKAKTINRQQHFDHTLKKSMMLVSVTALSLFEQLLFLDPLVFNKAQEDDSPNVYRLAGRWAAALDMTTRGQCYECINYVL